MPPDQDLYLGLDVGGTKCAAVVGTAAGKIVDRTQWPSLAERGPEPMIGDLISQGRAMLTRHKSVAGVGVAIGGPLDAEAGVIYSPPNLPGWDSVPLKQQLSSALGVGVFVEHDAGASALAEHRWGAGKAARILVYLTCGTGFGAGFVIDGRIYRGSHGRPSDIGHIRYRDDGPQAYGKRGSLEAFCAGAALTRLGAWRFPDRWGKDRPTSQQIAELAARGDEEAAVVLQLNARAVGDACAMIADMLYPNLILLGSLANYLGEPWLAQVRAQFAREAYPDARRFCQVGPTALGRRLGDSSALVVAMQGE